MENWRDIEIYDGKYEVSDLGRVKRGEYMLTLSDSNGYRAVSLNRKSYYVHQLVAIAFLGHVPCKGKVVVDHINTNKADNRLVNLQVISVRENSSKDKSGYVGVHWHIHRHKWIASIRIDGNQLYLGSFVNEIDAHHAYQDKLKSL